MVEAERLRQVTNHLELAEWRRRVAELYSRWRADSATDAERATRDFRAARDVLFRDHPQSPLLAADRPGFGGVPYYEYDPAYRIEATVDDAPQPVSPFGDQPLSLPTSGDEPFNFRRIGRVALGGPFNGATLSVFWIEGYAGGLFLPFRDGTSGNETYGAGRYLLDTIKGADLGGDPAQARLVLDFNMAYHPSCVYDPRWNCPLAPPENRLAVPVRVGERLR